MRQLIFVSRTFGCWQTSCGMLKVLTLSDSITSFTVTMLTSVSSGSNLGLKQFLFFLRWKKTRSSSALKWRIVKIRLTTFQKRRKSRAFSALSFVFPIKLQSESTFKSTRSVLHDSIRWSEISLSQSNWYSLNSSVKESNSDGSSKGRRLGYLWK